MSQHNEDTDAPTIELIDVPVGDGFTFANGSGPEGIFIVRRVSWAHGDLFDVHVQLNGQYQILEFAGETPVHLS